MKEQWQELKETIMEMRDNDGTGTQQEVCKFLVNYMDNLEKQIQEPCDCISRQALRQKLQEHHDFFINAFGSFKDMPLEDKARVDEISSCIAEVVNAPSVTPQPKVGEWLKNGELCKCSNCHSLVLRSVVKAYNYCFRCGAKMEVEE